MRALIIIARNDYQDIEYAGTREGLEKAGCTITVASIEAGECKGKLGGLVVADMPLRDVKVGEFDRVAFIGGPGARVLAENPDARRIARETVAADKVLGAICIAPMILARAGVLKGRRATVWDEDGGQEEVFQSMSITYTGEAITVDGRIVTANGPETAKVFGTTLAGL